MANRSTFIDQAVADYGRAHSAQPDEVLSDLRAVTEERTGGRAVMQIGDDQFALMEILARAMGVRAAIEVGTFTGTSALAVARGMGPDGRLLCLDTSEEWTAIARATWERAGVADRIELRIAPAIETLRSLPPTPQYDFAFVDADKAGYPAYYEELLPRIRPGGLLLADNTLRGGSVLDDSDTSDDAVAMRHFNDLVAADSRVTVVLLPIGDGVSIIQKR